MLLLLGCSGRPKWKPHARARTDSSCSYSFTHTGGMFLGARIDTSPCRPPLRSTQHFAPPPHSRVLPFLIHPSPPSLLLPQAKMGGAEEPCKTLWVGDIQVRLKRT